MTTKRSIVTALALLSFASCGNDKPSAPASGQSPQSAPVTAASPPARTPPQAEATPPPVTTAPHAETAPEPATAATPSSATPSPAASAKPTAPPVDVALTGPTTDKKGLGFRVSIKDANPVKQVDLHVAYLGADGKVTMETTYVWENIVNSERKPIVKGQSYTDSVPLIGDAKSANIKLARVVFADSTSWQAQ